MTTRAAARVLARRLIAPDGSVREDAAAAVLAGLRRPELKAFLAAVRREMRRHVVSITVAGADPEGDEHLRRTAAGVFPGRPLDVEGDPALGAGVRIADGDDIIDASVRGAVHRIIAELGSR